MKKSTTINNSYYCLDIDEYLTAEGKVWKRELTSMKRDTKETRIKEYERKQLLAKKVPYSSIPFPLKKDQ